MATIRIPVWIRSEYVTIGSPPFVRSGGKEAPPDLVRGTNRLPFIGSTGTRISQALTKCKITEKTRAPVNERPGRFAFETTLSSSVFIR